MHKPNAPGRNLLAKTFERSRRCQNCRSFENGPMAIQTYKTKKTADLNREAKKILETYQIPKGLNSPGRDQFNKQMATFGRGYELGDNLIRQGRLGICLRGPRPKADGGPEGDFVENMFLCNRWEAKLGMRPDGAEKGDLLPAEARTKIYGEDE